MARSTRALYRTCSRVGAAVVLARLVTHQARECGEAIHIAKIDLLGAFESMVHCEALRDKLGCRRALPNFV